MPITPQMLELALQYRARLLSRERRAASGLVRFYGRVWNQLQGDIRQLEGTISDMRAAGEDVGRGTIWRLERMKAIQRQANQEMAKFSQFAGETISGAQREAIAAGERDAHQLMLAGFPPDATIPISFTRMPRESVEAMVGTLQDGSPLVDLLQKAVGDAGEAFGETMVTGLAAGWNPRKLARELRSSFGMGLTRSLRIARTEQLRAYRTATLQSYQENSDVVTGWERLAALGPTCCLACVMLDGKRYGLDEPMDDHVNGKCSMTPITPTWRELGFDVDEPDFQREMGPDWFERQDEATQRQMMGGGMYDAWKAGKFELAGIPKLREDSVWGNSWVPKSLTELGGPVGAVPGFIGTAPTGEDRSTDIIDKWLVEGLQDPQAGAMMRRLGFEPAEEQQDWRLTPDHQRAVAKDQIVRTLSERTGIPPEKVNEFVEQWSKTSNDLDLRSLSIQADAAQLFGVPLSEWQEGSLNRVLDRIDRGVPPGLGAGKYTRLFSQSEQTGLLRTMYDHTQEELRLAGFQPGDTVRLRRGVGISRDLRGQLQRGGTVEMRGNVLESWSIGTDVGHFFAENAQRTSAASAVLIEMDVPIEAIIGSARTGFGCLTEGEFVTVGLRGRARVIELW